MPSHHPVSAGSYESEDWASPAAIALLESGKYAQINIDTA